MSINRYFPLYSSIFPSIVTITIVPYDSILCHSHPASRSLQVLHGYKNKLGGTSPQQSETRTRVKSPKFDLNLKGWYYAIDTGGPIQHTSLPLGHRTTPCSTDSEIFRTALMALISSNQRGLAFSDCGMYTILSHYTCCKHCLVDAKNKIKLVLLIMWRTLITCLKGI